MPPAVCFPEVVVPHENDYHIAIMHSDAWTSVIVLFQAQGVFDKARVDA